VNIRNFKLSDLPRVMQIERASFGQIGYSATTFLAHLCRDRKHSFVAEDEAGRLVGYMLVRMTLGWFGGRKGGITSIAVDPPHRRRGVGSALMEYALQHLLEQGVQKADLEVEVGNRAAQSLYESFGFRHARLLPHYYGPNRDGLSMVVDLAGARRAHARSLPTTDRAGDG
jgi:ribosomal-protein-alanine N-acetyltransferase